MARPGSWHGLGHGTAWAMERPGSWHGPGHGNARVMARPGSWHGLGHGTARVMARPGSWHGLSHGTAWVMARPSTSTSIVTLLLLGVGENLVLKSTCSLYIELNLLKYSRRVFHPFPLYYCSSSNLTAYAFTVMATSSPWHKSPHWARTSSLSRLYVTLRRTTLRRTTLRRTTLSRTPLDEWSARHRDHYLTNTLHWHKTDVHPPGGIRTHSPSRRAAADPRLRPHGHWDRHTNGYTPVRSCVAFFKACFAITTDLKIQRKYFHSRHVGGFCVTQKITISVALTSEFRTFTNLLPIA